MSEIIIKNIDFSYDEETPVLKNVSFQIQQGSYTTIIGHNGSGKSTIAKLLIGLMSVDKGEIFVKGMKLNEENINEIRKEIGIVFQNPDNQFIGSTVADDIAFGLENHQVDSTEMDNIINFYAKAVNMERFLNSEPTKLSGGQKQRVAIAGVLAISPDVIIFDEATSMLDPQGKEEINTLIQDIHKSKNKTIISITHDIEEVTKSDWVIVMDSGRVVMEGKPEAILKNSEQLINLKLDIPFASKLIGALAKKGIILEDVIDTEEVIEQLCQYNTKN